MDLRFEARLVLESRQNFLMIWNGIDLNHMSLQIFYILKREPDWITKQIYVFVPSILVTRPYNLNLQMCFLAEPNYVRHIQIVYHKSFSNYMNNFNSLHLIVINVSYPFETDANSLAYYYYFVNSQQAANTNMHKPVYLEEALFCDKKRLRKIPIQAIREGVIIMDGLVTVSNDIDPKLSQMLNRDYRSQKEFILMNHMNDFIELLFKPDLIVRNYYFILWINYIFDSLCKTDQENSIIFKKVRNFFWKFSIIIFNRSNWIFFFKVAINVSQKTTW